MYIGDKLLCKKDYYFIDSIIFNINKYYIVDTEYNQYDFGYDFYIIDNDGSSIGFHYNKETEEDYNRNYSEYFYTVNELRIFKLEKVDGI